MEKSLIKKKNLDVHIGSIGKIIQYLQKENGDIPWYKGSKTDPWDHVESAMGLSISGYFNRAMLAFCWIKKLQMSDGSFYSSYVDDIPDNKIKETNMSAYIAVGVFQYWLITKDHNFLKFMWDTVRNAINFVLNHQGPDGQIYWAVNSDGGIDYMALLTASSSVFMSLKCAIAISKELKLSMPLWRTSLEKLKNAIIYKKFLFNSSKSNFSMDWFYPILCGAITGDLAYARINKYWKKFVVDKLGVKCLSNRPWITIAESSELILTLNSIGLDVSAIAIFSWISKRIFSDGSYWCGFTYPDIVLWPAEKISWNNAVVLMAMDALYKVTPANIMFNHRWWEIHYDL